MDSFSSVIDKINERLKNSPLFYLSNDPERGLGLEGLLNNYHLCFIDISQYSDYFNQRSIKYFCLGNYRADNIYRNSGKLIKSPEFVEYFNHYSLGENFFQTFKISSQFEFESKKLDVTVLNTTSELNRKFEDKISQYMELSKLDISLPKTYASELKNLEYKELSSKLGGKLVVQFERGHTGSGTVFISEEKEFDELKKLYPLRHVRVSEYIYGMAYTLNGCVGNNNTYLGGLSAQITGVEGLTPQKGGTIGNDFYCRKDLVKGYKGIIKDIEKIAEHMRISGYRGLFGADLIVLPTGDHKIIEINARQPASIPMYTKMQILSGQIPLSTIHLMEFLKIPYDISSVEYNMINLEPQAYSQVFIRPAAGMTVNHEIPMRVYAMKGDRYANEKAAGLKSPKFFYIEEENDKAITKIKSGYSIEHLQDGGFLLLTQKKGRYIKENTELSRIQLKQKALDDSGNLMPWIKEILLAIKDFQI